MKKVILITNSYPYGNGETYIYPELEYIHDKQEVIIIPMGYNGTPCRRAVQDNIKILFPKKVKNSKITQGIKSIFSKPFFCGVIEMICDKKFCLKITKELLKFVYASRIHYYSIIEALNDYGIDDFSECIFYSYWMDSTSLAVTYFKKFDCKTVTRCHGGDLYDDRLPWKYQLLRKYITEHIDYVCPVSYQGKEYLNRRIGLHSNIIPMHLGIIDNGVASYDDGGIPIIVSCSSIIPLKRINLIIDALSFCKSKYKWVHFGEGSNMKQIKEYADEKLQNKDFVFEGSKSNHEVLKYYKHNNIKLFVNASNTEGVPVSIMEALSFGIPCVATNVGGVGELIDDGKNGRLVAADVSAHSLALAIDSILLLNGKEYEELRNNSRKSFLNDWNNEINYKKFYSLINS